MRDILSYHYIRGGTTRRVIYINNITNIYFGANFESGLIRRAAPARLQPSNNIIADGPESQKSRLVDH